VGGGRGGGELIGVGWRGGGGVGGGVGGGGGWEGGGEVTIERDVRTYRSRYLDVQSWFLSRNREQRIILGFI